MTASLPKKQSFLLTMPILLLTAIWLVSCMSARQIPQDHYYRLPFPTVKSYAAPVFSGTVGVKKIRTDGILNDRSLLYIKTSHPLEIKRSNYHHWQEAPAVLLQKHLAAFMSASGAVEQIILYEPGMVVDTLISGHLLQFEREIGEKETSIYVVLELAVTTAQKTLTHTYSQRITCDNTTIEAAADAFGTALVNIYRDFLSAS